MCLAGILAGTGVKYVTGPGFGVSDDSGTRSLRFLRMMAVGVCTAYCLALRVSFKTTPCLSSVVILLMFLELMMDVSFLDDGC